MPHISIKPEPLIHVFGISLTNSYITSLIVIALFFVLALYYNQQVKNKNKSKFFYLLHFIIKSIYGLFQSVMVDRINIFFPLLGSFFIYILIQNWFGLLPGVGSLLIKIKEGNEEIMAPIFRGNNADLNTTLALGLISFTLIQYYGFKFLGVLVYLKKFINISSPINFALGILEIISEFSKILSFSFRLFGNIFAGEVLIVIIAFLIPVLASFPFLLLELFVGLVQALVFSMLTAVFINMAITKSH